MFAINGHCWRLKLAVCSSPRLVSVKEKMLVFCVMSYSRLPLVGLETNCCPFEKSMC